MIQMSNTLLRELFRGLESSIHERLVVLEELIRNTEEPHAEPRGTIEQSLQITRMDPGLQERLSTIDTTLHELFALQKSIGNAMKESNRRVEDVSRALSESKLHETDVSKALAQIQARLEALETIMPSDAEEEAEAEVAEADDHVIEEEEETEVADEEEEEEEEEVVEEEEVGLEGEEFTYKGVTLFRSTDNKVYQPDEDGSIDPDAPYGLWVANPKLPEGGKITRLPN